ncbi:unnamed protein product, partial [Didymodactylos carnosus]
SPSPPTPEHMTIDPCTQNDVQKLLPLAQTMARARLDGMYLPSVQHMMQGIDGYEQGFTVRQLYINDEYFCILYWNDILLAYNKNRDSQILACEAAYKLMIATFKMKTWALRPVSTPCRSNAEIYEGSRCILEMN